MDKERIDGFRSAFAPGETLFWQVPAAARERMAFYSENLPRLFLKKSRRYLRCPTTMRWNLCDFCRDRASAALKPCGTAPPAMPASFCRWSWWNGKAQGGCHVRLYEDPLQNRHSGLPSKGSGTPRSPWRFGHGGRAFYVYFPSTTESLISFSVSLRSRAPPSATVTRSS